MREEVIRVVEAYINAVRNNDQDALPLHPDVVFESPLSSIKGIDEFRKGLKDFVPILKSIEIVRLTADDDTCAAVLELDTIFGLLPFLEYFHVVDGQIVSIRAYYNPRPVVEGAGRTGSLPDGRA
jgi:limonene-1,2-epoxide hydrolase